MKKATVENIFRILKAFIYDEKPVITGDCDWDEIFYCAKIHSVTGITGYIVTRYGLCDVPDFAAMFENNMIQIYGYQYRRCRQAEKLIDIMNQNQIDHILMKGYLVKDIYPVPELRSFGDLDFVIKKEDRSRMNELMINLGYENHGNWEPVYSYKKDTEYYEIHTEVLDGEIGEGGQREYFRDCWKHTFNKENCTYCFNREYHFIYLIAHLAKHASKRGAGLRMYLDIALIIQQYRETLDWEYIMKQLEILQLKRFFYTVCTVCKQWFDVRKPCETDLIDPEVIDLFTQITVEGGTFGFHAASDAMTTLKETDQSQSRAETILKQIFPSADEIKARYTYLQKHRWLLPAAWIDRIFRNRKLLGYQIKMAKDLATADEKEVQKIRDLNKEIGL